MKRYGRGCEEKGKGRREAKGQLKRMESYGKDVRGRKGRGI